MPLNENDIPNKQSALVLQGRGALGAYEAGALTVLCKELTISCIFLVNPDIHRSIWSKLDIKDRKSKAEANKHY